MDTVVEHVITAVSWIKNGSHLEDSCHYTLLPPSLSTPVTSFETLTICRRNHSLYYCNDTSDVFSHECSKFENRSNFEYI